MTNDILEPEKKIYLPTDKPLFYLFGLVYNFIIIFFGSIILSGLKIFITTLGFTLGLICLPLALIVTSLMQYDFKVMLLLIPFGAISAFLIYFLVGISVMNLSLLPLPVVSPLVLITCGFLLVSSGYVVYHLLKDLIAGVLSSSLDFYNTILAPGKMNAFLSPFQYLNSQRSLIFNPSSNYHKMKNDEFVLNTYITILNDHANLILFCPEAISSIITEYLFCERLIRIGSKLFPVFLPEKIIGLLENTFFNHFKGWLGNKPVDKRNQHELLQSDGEEILEKSFNSHGFIKCKLRLLSDDPEVLFIENDTIYLIKTKRDIDGQRHEVLLYDDKPIDKEYKTRKMVKIDDIRIPGDKFSYDIHKIEQIIESQGHPIYKKIPPKAETIATQLIPGNIERRSLILSKYG